MGLVVRPGSIESGDVPRFIIFGGNFVSELSIFIDESGDFGPYDYRSPYYIITMVFHDQSVDISTPITKLEADLSNRGFPNQCVHTGPIIRRENEYEFETIETRRRILNSMVTFIKHCNVKYHSFHIEKKHIEDSVQASAQLSLLISRFLRNHYEELLSYDKVKIYYDNGQIEISRILASVFTVLLPEVEIKKVTPSDYRLFQTADMFCSMELIRLKMDAAALSPSELEFFGNVRDMKKNYLNPLEKFRWD